MARAKFCMFCGVGTSNWRGVCDACDDNKERPFAILDRVVLTALAFEWPGCRRYRNLIGTVIKKPRRNCSIIWVKWDGIEKPDSLTRECIEPTSETSLAPRCENCGFPQLAVPTAKRSRGRHPIGNGTFSVDCIVGKSKKAN
jgi:hypothetical protein